MEILRDNSRKEFKKFPGALSRWFFWYHNETFTVGNQRKLTKNDIYKIPEEYSSQTMVDVFKRLWSNEIQQKQERNKKPNFLSAVFRFLVPKLLFPLMLMTFSTSLRIASTFFLKFVVEAILTGSTTEGYYWATALAFGMLGQWLCHHQFFYRSEVVGNNIKTGILGLIYQKALKLSTGSLGTLSTGHVVTLVTTDTRKIQESIKILPFIPLAPVSLVVVSVILINQFGVAALTGIALLVIFIPLQIVAGKFFAKMRFKVVKNTDKRVSTMNEIITSMQVTKMYTWEDSYAQLINDVRKKETSSIFTALVVRGINYAFYSSSPYIIGFVIFATFYGLGGQLTLSSVFQTISLLFASRFEICFMFPTGIQCLNEMKVACHRIQNILMYDEMSSEETSQQSTSSSSDDQKHGSEENIVHFKNVTASWDKNAADPILQSVDLKCDRENCLVMVVGPVGSGKSSLLMAAMNELHVKKGEIKVQGSTAFTTQQPWIFSGTVRQNILFGREYKKDWYQTVIKACGMHTDIRRFKHGDLTLVGEKGVTLSGGQKARVALARAVYSDKDIYYLDDPLSAVDTKVGRYIFENCIQKLLKDKLVILVTHQVQFLKNASDILCLQYGNVCEGSLNDFQNMGIDLGSIMDTESVVDRSSPSKNIGKDGGGEGFLESNDDDDNVLDEKELLLEDGVDDSQDQKLNNKLKALPDHLTSNLDVVGNMSAMSLYSNNEIEDVLKEQDNQDETMASGSLSFKVVRNYFYKGLGCFLTFLLPVFLVSGQVVLTFTDYYMAQWARSEQERNTNQTITSPFYYQQNADYNIIIFGSIVLFAVLLDIVRIIYFFYAMVRCNRHLHDAMFTSILKAPIYFFNTHPVGQILNRFSRDTHLVDEELPWILCDALRILLLLLAIVTINCFSVPYILIIVIPLFVIFVKLRTYYMNIGREVKRLDAVARSPLYTHLSATLSGISTIRAFGLQNRVTNDFHDCTNYQAESWLMFISSVRWFGMRLDFISLVYSMVAIFSPIILLDLSGEMDPNIASVSITYALTLSGLFQFCVRQSAEAENLMVSVERLMEYADIENEPDNGDLKADKNWPEKGRITASHTSFRYHQSLDNVLKKISFVINGREKIGVVGRTGAGKSTLLNLLFRMGVTDGRVIIDDVDISRLKLKDLRRSLSIIPQDPVLFNGTLRKNLDPFSKYTDDQIWQALTEVQLSETVGDLPNKLETEVAESGSNFSVGERQLLCLARALLKRNKILVIDEATANVDFETDSLIQETIRMKFQDCTVLTIAHRLNTIIDSDRVMVMDEGEIVEFDLPYNLLQTSDGHLRKLVDQTGEVEAKRLESLAREAMSAKIDDSIMADNDVEEQENGPSNDVIKMVDEEMTNSLQDGSENEKEVLVKEKGLKTPEVVITGPDGAKEPLLSDTGV
ncbi:ATP-binding cassette sub-family C member 4-like [Clytia hemisphaerica]|uniref:Uncharacterized protein n=1 Tax=Clytia hemisphaerica TaxID=252671 RepID=A0A7M5X7L4_9CNID